jgi:hypothetical protein
MADQARRLNRRTSITVDEAVAILLGQADRPIEIESARDFEAGESAEEAEENRPVFDLDVLEDECDVAEGEYDLARHEGAPARVIAEKQNAFVQKKQILEKAYDYLCAIDDELNKGERSLLRLDVHRTNPAYRYITLHSFMDWTRRENAAEHLSAAERAPRSADRNVGEGSESRSRDKMERQWKAIIAAIKELREVPTAMTEEGKGLPGMRSRVWHIVKKQKELFGTHKTFENAWSAALREGIIAYAKKTDPPIKKVE